MVKTTKSSVTTIFVQHIACNHASTIKTSLYVTLALHNLKACTTVNHTPGMRGISATTEQP